MGFAAGDIVLKQANANVWVVREPIIYSGARDAFVVPPGFRTDLASVPRPLVWLLPRYGAYTKSAILHDFLCKHPEVVDRADADGIFRRSMHELDVAFLRRWLMWAAVRFASRLSGATAGERLAWVVVALPGLAFVAVPGLLVLIWLAAFWVCELVAFGALRLLRRNPRRPRLLLTLDQPDDAPAPARAPQVHQFDRPSGDAVVATGSMSHAGDLR